MVTLASSSLCNSISLIHSSKPWNPISFPLIGSQNLPFFRPKKKNSLQNTRMLKVSAVTDGSAKKDGEDNINEPSVPSWAKPGSDEPPPWARDEAQKDSSGFQVPFFVYLLASAVAAIAAIGSVFEYVNQRPAFGVVQSDSVFYAPLLGLFAFTGIPTSAFLWFKSVQVANKEAEEQDRRDGYL
ncbi:hypothetical protein ACH5RR_013504 [Cinchona calisaya]|uniref:Transmembrane protein n=1 Tax=Cinchona calisaya TaxID=153742 RepID=A0ABD3A0B2_9GENT